MALTPAEKQKAYRDRQKRKAKAEARKGGDMGADLFHTPYSEWAEHDDNVLSLIEYTALAGFELPPFDNERDPEEFVIDRELFGAVELFEDAKGALGRAEVTIGVLLDAAMILAGSVNSYKQHEIKQRLAELENSDTADRATAMSEAVKLNKILDQLNEQVRRPFPQWRVTGV
jgi:hypothetical protein